MADEIQYHVNELEKLMKFVHGGDWSVDIDHEDCFILIALDLQ